ncbi:hypothetical protein B0H21DRAFT_890065 [Amylocystis lapponica]|nr:hypothetical protein B0H21DRAFT_890065 [Amylocystis lapponica]
MRFSTITVVLAAVAAPALALQYDHPAYAVHSPNYGVATVHPVSGARIGTVVHPQARELLDEYVRREAIQEGSGANWLTSIGKGLFGLIDGNNNNNNRREAEDMFNSVLKREIVDEFVRREAVQAGSGANWLTSIGKGIFSLFSGGNNNNNRREFEEATMLKRDIIDEYVRREAVQAGSGANWLTSIGKGILGLFGGNNNNNNRAVEDASSSMLKREIMDEYVRREAVQAGSGANWLTSLGKGIFSLFSGNNNNNNREVEDVSSSMLKREIMDEYVRREAVQAGSGANWLTSLGKGIFSLFGGNNNNNNREFEDVSSSMLRREIMDEYVRREAVQQGSGANWLTSLGKGIFSLFSGNNNN